MYNRSNNLFFIFNGLVYIDYNIKKKSKNIKYASRSSNDFIL